ncbi:DUF4397 domain-containing protein [Myxococcus fulvus]|uniref:DUF4397 domain-containing protein n=1 Tax=Myxococcus fulvus TaxID=33 RepID=UPI0021000F64|nr:DUF4397 domain-containing protein [Myxococcus fulvus]
MTQSRLLRVWLLMLAGLLLVGPIGCGDDSEDPRPDSGVPDSGVQDAGRDSGPGPVDSGPDGGPVVPDAGTPDAGPVVPDAGTPDAGMPDAGPDTRPRARVRFVNAFLGSKGNPTDVTDQPWAPFSVDLHVGSTKLFTSVEAGSEAVTAFQEVILTGDTQEVEFVARDTEGGESAPVLAQVGFTLEAGKWVTVVGAGSLLQVGQERPDRPRLVVLRDDALVVEAEPDLVRVRFMSADRVTSATATRRFADTSGNPYGNNTVNAYSPDEHEEGVPVPVDTSRVAIIGTSPAFTPSQSGWLYYSVPQRTFEAGQAYYAINTGEDRRTLPDDGASALLIITAKQDRVVRLRRGPLVYFFNGLLSATPGGTASSLQVVYQSLNVATGITYGTSPKVADLPVSETGVPVRVTVSGQPGQAVLESANSGPLEAGGRYLGVLCGRQGASPTLTVVRERFAAEVPPSAFLRFIHCSASAPTPIDFGSYSMLEDGFSRGDFSPLLTGASFLTATEPAAGVAFSPPVSNTSPAYTWLGVRTTGESSLERFIRGRVLATPSFLILIGEWEGSLTYRTLNIRQNNWGASGPNDANFSPLPEP